MQSERVWIVKAPLRRPVLGKPSPFGSPFGEGRSLVQPRTRFGKKHWRDKALRSYSGQQAEPRLEQLRAGLQRALQLVRADYRALHIAADWLAQLADVLDPDGKPVRSAARVRVQWQQVLDDLHTQSVGSPRLL